MNIQHKLQQIAILSAMSMGLASPIMATRKIGAKTTRTQKKRMGKNKKGGLHGPTIRDGVITTAVGVITFAVSYFFMRSKFAAKVKEIRDLGIEIAVFKSELHKLDFGGLLLDREWRSRETDKDFDACMNTLPVAFAEQLQALLAAKAAELELDEGANDEEAKDKEAKDKEAKGKVQAEWEKLLPMILLLRQIDSQNANTSELDDEIELTEEMELTEYIINWLKNIDVRGLSLNPLEGLKSFHDNGEEMKRMATTCATEYKKKLAAMIELIPGYQKWVKEQMAEGDVVTDDDN